MAKRPLTGNDARKWRPFAPHETRTGRNSINVQEDADWSEANEGGVESLFSTPSRHTRSVFGGKQERSTPG